MKKRILAVTLAAVMALGMSFTASATESNTTTQATAKAEAHTYTAYQIFAGKNFNGTLSNVTWGNGVPVEVQKLIIGALGLPGDSTLDEVLSALKDENNDSVKLNEVAKVLVANKDSLTNGIAVDGTEVDNGYYIIIDTTENLPAGDSRNFGVLQVVDNKIEIKEKRGTVTVDKYVKDINDSSETEKSAWKKTADHDLGDAVDFQLVANLNVDRFEEYTTYYVAFHDTESAGLTFNDDVKVYCDGKEVDSSYYIVEKDNCSDNCTFEVIIDDVKLFDATANSVITAEYTATVNESAIMGATGNPNEVYLEYSASQATEEKGKTESVKVIVFTYNVTVDKVNEKEEPLAGAGFTLYKEIAGVGEAENTITKEGKVYQPYRDEISYGENVVEGQDVTVFSFDRIDDGDYLLVETTTPDGYNTMEPLAFTVTADHDDVTLALTSLSGNRVDGSVETGIIEFNVINKSGSILPSTGGIGTTMFYVIGSALIVFGGVLVFTRRRVRRQNF